MTRGPYDVDASELTIRTDKRRAYCIEHSAITDKSYNNVVCMLRTDQGVM
jgi:hypothetical protein